MIVKVNAYHVILSIHMGYIKPIIILIHIFQRLSSNLSLHPAPSTIRGVVQTLAGVGEQGVALFLQVDEVSIRRCVSATGREAAGRIRRDIESTRSGGKDLTTDEEQVTEGAVRSVRAAGRPGTAIVGGHINGVVAWVDAEEFPLGEDTAAGMDDLWHSMIWFWILYLICFYVFSLNARLRHSHHWHTRKE